MLYRPLFTSEEVTMLYRRLQYDNQRGPQSSVLSGLLHNSPIFDPFLSQCRELNVLHDCMLYRHVSYVCESDM